MRDASSSRAGSLRCAYGVFQRLQFICWRRGRVARRPLRHPPPGEEFRCAGRETARHGAERPLQPPRSMMRRGRTPIIASRSSHRRCRRRQARKLIFCLWRFPPPEHAIGIAELPGNTGYNVNARYSSWPRYLRRFPPERGRLFGVDLMHRRR